ncbi:MAG: tetraacyldisaccharide 4'-kinase [Salibacteraceae bacterium]
MVAYLLKALSEKQIAVVSRGYGRKSTGAIKVSETVNPRQVGDEIAMLKDKFPDVAMYVSERRKSGIDLALSDNPQLQVILLDDAYQHRSVHRDVDILLTSFQKPFTRDFIIPVGRLREPRSSAKRASAVVVTKCPHRITRDALESLKIEISRYTTAPVFFSKPLHGQPRQVFGKSPDSGRQIVLVTGIVQAEILNDHLRRAGYDVVKHFEYPDHHWFNKSDIQKISDVASGSGASIFTTEKDWQRMKLWCDLDTFADLSVYVIPFEHSIVNEEEFSRFITNAFSRVQ